MKLDRKSGLYWVTFYYPINENKICYWCSKTKIWSRSGNEIVGIKEVDERELDNNGIYKK